MTPYESDECGCSACAELIPTYRMPKLPPRMPRTILTIGGSRIYPPITDTPCWIVRRHGVHLGVGATYAEAQQIAQEFEATL